MLELTYTKGQLNPAIQRFIKREERSLGRTCRKIWTFKNPNGEIFLFANFCKNYDRLIVTIGIFNPNVIGKFLPPDW